MLLVTCSGIGSHRECDASAAGFKVWCDGKVVHVKGTTGVEVAAAVMWFLKYRCRFIRLKMCGIFLNGTRS